MAISMYEAIKLARGDMWDPKKKKSGADETW